MNYFLLTKNNIQSSSDVQPIYIRVCSNTRTGHFDFLIRTRLRTQSAGAGTACRIQSFLAVCQQADRYDSCQRQRQQQESDYRRKRFWRHGDTDGNRAGMD